MLYCYFDNNTICCSHLPKTNCSLCIISKARNQGKIAVDTALENSLNTDYLNTFYEILQKRLQASAKSYVFPQFNSPDELVQAIKKSSWIESSHLFRANGYRLFITDNFFGRVGYVRISHLDNTAQLIANETKNGYFKLTIKNVQLPEDELTYLVINTKTNQIVDIHPGEPFASDVQQTNNLTNGEIISPKMAQARGFRFANIIL